MVTLDTLAKPIEMLTYNTQLKKLVLPEYGRNIQQMVDHCLTIEDREERTACAYSIINSMGNLFPQLRDVDDFKHKLWDHLAIMSDFKLDIDYPCDIIRPENLESRPCRVSTRWHTVSATLRSWLLAGRFLHQGGVRLRQ